MKPGKARAWLDEVLSAAAGAIPDSAALERLLDECGPENLHHEYKAGAELAIEKKAAATLRQYVAGFANADGGVLLAGVTDDRLVDGCVRPGGQPLDEWATRALAAQVAYFSPQPRLFVVPYTGKLGTAAAPNPAEVLVVAVERSPQLVPCVEGPRQVFYFRIGDSTLAAPDYLLADLILGRRSHPRFMVPRILCRLLGGVSREDIIGATNSQQRNLAFAVNVENDSMVFARDVRVGMVAWILSEAQKRSAPQSLRARVDVPQDAPPAIPQDPSWKPPWMLAHVQAFESMEDAPRPQVDLAAFERSDNAYLNLRVPVPPNISRSASVPADAPPDRAPWYRAAFAGRVVVHAALYVLARNTEPTWFQVTVRYTPKDLNRRDELHHLRVTVEAYGRLPPRVSWDFDDSAP